jgi:undecaprenyl-diphosphatase
VAIESQAAGGIGNPISESSGDFVQSAGESSGVPSRQHVLDYICQRDHRLMRRVHRWRAPRWIRLWMLCATRGGDGWLWYTLGFFVFLFGGTERFRALAASGLAAGVGVTMFLLLKRLTGRKRPCALEPHCWATLLPPDQFSFPSGHSITAFAFAIPLMACYPSLSIGLVFCAISIAASRVLLGMHFLSDVLAGSAIGIALGYIAMLLL